jgi:hypothetical protein
VVIVVVTPGSKSTAASAVLDAAGALVSEAAAQPESVIAERIIRPSSLEEFFEAVICFVFRLVKNSDFPRRLRSTRLACKLARNAKTHKEIIRNYSPLRAAD